MTEPIYCVYGASGCGRGIMPLARAQIRAHGVSTNRLFFVDDAALPDQECNGHRVLTWREFLDFPATARYAAVAISSSTIREKIAAQLVYAGVEPWSVAAATVQLMDDVKLGPGSLLSPFVTLTSNIKIGSFFHANLYSYVEHDCVIGDYVTFAPGVKCNGNILIEDHVYVGAGAVIRQGKPGTPLVIGRGAIVGMGAVVTKSVPAGAIVVGNPARVMRKE